MPKLGVTQTPNASFERIARAIQTIDRTAEFTSKGLSQITGLNRAVVNRFLRVKLNAGYLVCVERGVYRHQGICIRTIAPLGIVAEALWAVLSTDPLRAFRTSEDIVCDAEKYIGRPEYSARISIRCALHYWHRSGHVEREGRRGDYKYRLREGVVDRPLTVRRGK